MAQGCAVGLFDGEVRCFDRPITMRGRGGNFRLKGHYCLCDGDLCNQKSKIWIQYGPKKFYAQRQKAGRQFHIFESFQLSQECNFLFSAENFSKFLLN